VKLLAARARILADVRAFFASRGYIEVDTSLVVPSPGLDLHLDAFEVFPTGVVANRALPARFLITSPEYQMKRLLAEGHGRIFQITHAFRAGESGEHHNPEFTLVEFYLPHARVESIMRDTEQLVARVTGGFVELGSRRIDARPPFARITVFEAFERWANTSSEEVSWLAKHDENRFFQMLVETIEPQLAKLEYAVFLTDYPIEQASLARKKPSMPAVAERFELYVAGVELCNGFGELTDEGEQRARLKNDQERRRQQKKPVYPIDERFLSALAQGMPDSAGNAIGFDRLVALACGTTKIRDIMAFTDDEL
jgi:lysyl-tRNA synthetase class 2